ncbi:MAG: LysR family transcriptional regulator [Acidiphilium sp. 34-60-192]|nr:MAG: LysR family transcriptional regulator [Acidiphilium sp. 34-60-192]
MDQLALYTTFVRVAERGSFSAVARDLKTSQPMISRHISALEDHLGVRLVQRTTRHLHLTEDGQALLPHARAILESLEAAAESIGKSQTMPSGRVRVGVPTSLGIYMARRLNALFATYPQLSLDLKLRDGTFDLVEEALDLVIAITQSTQSSLITRRLGLVASALVASPDYLARHGAPRQPADLLNHECIVYSRPGVENNWRFAALLPRVSVVDDIETGCLALLLPDHEPARVPLYAVMPSRRHVAPRTRAVLDFLINELETTPFTKPSGEIDSLNGKP